jgi:hypothetical protein
MMEKRLGLASTVSITTKTCCRRLQYVNFLLSEILCGDQNLVKWIEVKGCLPKEYVHLNLVEGGQDAEGTPLFCAQIEFKGSITPGK